MECVRLATLVLVLGLVCETWCWGDSYLRDKFDPPDSDEHGQHVGKKRTTCKCGWTNKAAGRIVGGTEAQVNEYPHMVALARKDYLGRRHFFCGGTIATEHHVVTAAHCIATLPRGTVLYIVAGEHQTDTMFETRYTKEYKVDQIIPHEQYNTATYANDIAVLYFNKKIEFSDAVGPACLPKKPVNLEGEYVKVTGWGHEQWKGKVSTVLRKVNLKVISINDCAPKYALGSINTRTPTQFCTYGPSKDSCQGDSGGPVTWLDPETNRYTLVGVVSFGSICASPTPGVNTMVHSHINWLENIIRSTGPNNIRTCCKED